MPTYTVNMGGDPAARAWADGASALAQALTPDYKGMADAKVAASRAYGNYAAADANQALARERAAGAALDENKLAAIQAFSQAVGDLPAEDQITLLYENFGAMGLSGTDVQNLVGTFANTSTGLDQARIEQLRGTDYGDTQAGEEALLAQQGQQAIALEQAKPIVTDGQIVGGVGDPRFENYPGRVAPFGNEITGGNTIFRPQFGEDGIYTGVEEYTAPKLTDNTVSTSDWKNYVWQGEDGSQQQALARDDGTGRLVMQDGTPLPSNALVMGSVAEMGDTRSPTEIAIAEATSEENANAWQAGNQASREIARIEFMEQVLAATGGTGKLTELTMPMRSVLASMGLADADLVTAQQIFNVEAGKSVMATLALTKGAISNFEMNYFATINEGLGQLTNTNEIILYTKKRALQRAVAAQQIVEEGLAANVGDRVIQRQLNELYATFPIMEPHKAAQWGLPPPPTAGGGFGGGTDADAELERLKQKFGG